MSIMNALSATLIVLILGACFALYFGTRFASAAAVVAPVAQISVAA